MGRSGISVRRRSRRIAAIAGLLLAALPAAAASSDAPPPEGRVTEEIVVRARRAPTAAVSSFTRGPEAWDLRPLDSPSQLLEVVPGLVTAQHTGGGKSDQYLIRGFDADHGTDIAISFDGIPVNLRSHAHGQGFADVHFVIPETIERIEVTKGTYDVEVGDFATAASVEFVPYDRVDESFAVVEIGEFDSYRAVAVGSPRFGPFAGPDPRADVLAAFEAYFTDGPFESAEDLERFSGYLSGGVDVGESGRIHALASYYASAWDASGLVPKRTISQGVIDRFGSIDPTEGGRSRRANALLRYVHELSPAERVEVTAWASYYELTLWSNFTYFLNDPVNGDGIVQRDTRWLYGGEIVYRRALDLGRPIEFTFGLDTRTDDATVRLGRQRQRDDFLGFTTYDDVLETSLAGFLEAEAQLASWARADVGLRSESFWFDVESDEGAMAEDPTGSGTGRDGILLPKANLVLQPFAEGAPLSIDSPMLRATQLFANFGIGYHSNDARAVVHRGGENALPRATGWEVGVRTRIADRLDLAFAYWYLQLQDELVFVGDEGRTEASGRSKRRGIEVVASLALTDWLFWDGTLTYSKAQLEGGAAVPQAPRLTATTSLTALHESGFSAQIRMRALDRRYGVEDRSVELSGWAVFDLGLRYRRGPVEVAFSVENLFDTDWAASEFFYPSCTSAENGVEMECTPPGGGPGISDPHLTPGSPRNVRGSLTLYF